MTLNELRPLVEMIAAERTTSTPHLFDDAVQEGLIAAWQAHRARPDAPRQYLVGAARNGVRSVLRGRPMTGAPSHRGRVDAADHAVHVDLPHVAYVETPRVELLEVTRAVDALAPLDATICRLRGDGHDWRHIGPTVGLHHEAARRRFVQHIAPRLAAELHHLRGAA